MPQEKPTEVIQRQPLDIPIEGEEPGMPSGEKKSRVGKASEWATAHSDGISADAWIVRVGCS